MLKANPEKIRALVTEIFVRKDVPAEDAAVIGETVIRFLVSRR